MRPASFISALTCLAAGGGGGGGTSDLKMSNLVPQLAQTVASRSFL